MPDGSVRLSRRARWAWRIGFLLACVSFATLRCTLESQRQTNLFEWNGQSILNDHLRDLNGHWKTEVEAVLGTTNVRVPQRIAPQLLSAIVPGAALDPRFDRWKVRLLFTGPRGGETLWDSAIIPPPEPLNRPSQFWWGVEYARFALFCLGVIAWLAGLALTMTVRGVRVPVASVCLAAALVCMMSAVLSIDWHWEAWREFAAVPAWRYFDGAVLMSLIALIVRLIPSRPPAVGVCAHCGYDLTGNVSGVCPECGTETESFSRQRRLAELEPTAHRLSLMSDSAPPIAASSTQQGDPPAAELALPPGMVQTPFETKPADSAITAHGLSSTSVSSPSPA